MRGAWDVRTLLLLHRRVFTPFHRGLIPLRVEMPGLKQSSAGQTLSRLSFRMPTFIIYLFPESVGALAAVDALPATGILEERNSARGRKGVRTSYVLGGGEGFLTPEWRAALLPRVASYICRGGVGACVSV